MNSTSFRRSYAVLGVVLLIAMTLPSSPTVRPAHAATNSSVLDYLYSISGSKTVAGQHNREPNSDPDQWTEWIYRVTGKYPGLWGGDFLFRYDDVQPHNREKMIAEAKEQWNNGALVTLTWHVCPPHFEEHCALEDGVMSHLSPEQWEELVTDGSTLNGQWKARIDTIVPYLEDLKDSGVEVLWRPLHEMNADWCWWCGQPGPNGSRKLYQITHDYMTNVKGLTNLIWVWNVKDVDIGNIGDYYPGDSYVDVVSLDPWVNGYTMDNYNAMLNIANGKPIAIGEAGKLPTPAVLAAQPRWTWFLGWAELVKQQNSICHINALYNDAPVVNRGGTNTSIDHMEAVGDWQVVTGTGALTATLTAVPGCGGQAVQLNYNLGTTPGAYVQLRRDFSPPLDLSGGDHLRFFHQGTTTNTLQIGLVSADSTVPPAERNYFSYDMGRTTHSQPWTHATWDLQAIRKGDQPFPDLGKVAAIFISVKIGSGDAGGVGSFTVDELQYYNIAARTVPPGFEWIDASAAVTRTQKAAAWIAARQQPNGLLKSWQEETAHNAWLYDQALGLLVLSETNPSAAQRLANALHQLQHKDGYWYAGYDYTKPLTPPPSINTTKPVGANAWAVYALARYHLMRGSTEAQQDARDGAAWLASLQRKENEPLAGSLPALPGETTAPTEPNLDAWWAFRATGHYTQMNDLQRFLLAQAWDPQMGRFKASPDSYEIFLDNQTWGAAFLHAICHEHDARRALSYAHWTLATTSNDERTYGFDGAGPFSVWNEGTLQYVAEGGENSQFYWEQMAGQQASDGGLPGSPDEFQGYTVWLTTMHGVAPTAWLYFAGTGGPFTFSCVRLALIRR